MGAPSTIRRRLPQLFAALSGNGVVAGGRDAAGRAGGHGGGGAAAGPRGPPAGAARHGAALRRRLAAARLLQTPRRAARRPLRHRLLRRRLLHSSARLHRRDRREGHPRLAGSLLPAAACRRHPVRVRGRQMGASDVAVGGVRHPAHPLLRAVLLRAGIAHLPPVQGQAGTGHQSSALVSGWRRSRHHCRSARDGADGVGDEGARRLAAGHVHVARGGARPGDGRGPAAGSAAVRRQHHHLLLRARLRGRRHHHGPQRLRHRRRRRPGGVHAAVDGGGGARGAPRVAGGVAGRHGRLPGGAGRLLPPQAAQPARRGRRRLAAAGRALRLPAHLLAGHRPAALGHDRRALPGRDQGHRQLHLRRHQLAPLLHRLQDLHQPGGRLRHRHHLLGVRGHLLHRRYLDLLLRHRDQEQAARADSEGARREVVTCSAVVTVAVVRCERQFIPPANDYKLKPLFTFILHLTFHQSALSAKTDSQRVHTIDQR